MYERSQVLARILASETEKHSKYLFGARLKGVADGKTVIGRILPALA